MSETENRFTLGSMVGQRHPARLRYCNTVGVVSQYGRRIRFGGGSTAGLLHRPLVDPYGLVSYIRFQSYNPR